jgi:hypothetical protein
MHRLAPMVARIAHNASQQPGKTAVIAKGVPFTYQKLAADAGALSGLVSAGTKTPHVGVLCGSNQHYVVCVCAPPARVRAGVAF